MSIPSAQVENLSSSGGDATNGKFNDTNVLLTSLLVQSAADKKHDPLPPTPATQQIVQAFCSGPLNYGVNYDSMAKILFVLGCSFIVYGVIRK